MHLMLWPMPIGKKEAIGTYNELLKGTMINVNIVDMINVNIVNMIKVRKKIQSFPRISKKFVPPKFMVVGCIKRNI